MPRRWIIGVISLTTLVALLLLAQSVHGGHFGRLAEYDDGVYFDAAIALLHGVFPYRDFVFLQPPLIAIWLAPWAAIGSVTSERFGFELARVATDVVPLMSVILVARLTRRKGLARSLVATGVTALSIGTIHASQTVLLEPYLVVLCLGGLALFGIGQPHVGSNARLIGAGVLFGLAGATKVWAIIPVAVLIWRMPEGTWSHRIRFGIGVAAGFLFGAGPFLMLAPRRAITDFVITQAVRGPSGMDLPARLADLAGLHLLVLLANIPSPVGAIVVVGVVLGAIAAIVSFTRRAAARARVSKEDQLLRTLAVVIGLILVATPAYYYHYAAFFAPFLGLALSTLPTPSAHHESRSTHVRLHKLGGQLHRFRYAAIVLVTASYLIGDFLGVVRPVVENQAVPSRPVALSTAGCVVSDLPAFEILTNSTTVAQPGCPHVVDWLGVERVMVHGISGEPQDAMSNAFQGVVLGWFRSADTVILAPIDAGIGYNARRYLATHFTLARIHPDRLRIYRRKHGSSG
jgi:hypothetical protein